MSRFWSKNVHDLTPYIPGEQPKIENLIKLNTNENPYGPSPKVISAIKSAASDDLRKYPDPNAVELKKAAANYHKLNTNQVFVGNSSDEVLAHTFRAFFVNGDEQQSKPLLIPNITYSFYPVWCQLFNITTENISLRDDFSIDVSLFKRANSGIIFANPNAPTGMALPLDDIQNILDNNPNSVVVIDEAYADFAEKSAISLINQYPNLLVTQTLSKSRSLAGLRVGFAFASAELIDGLERVKNSFHPYALNQLAIAGAIAAFEDVDYFTKIREKVIATRERTKESLQKLGFSVLPSKTNFVLAQHPKIAAESIFHTLRAKGIVVRYFTSERIDQFIRISIGTDHEMDTLISTLNQIITNDE